MKDSGSDCGRSKTQRSDGAGCDRGEHPLSNTGEFKDSTGTVIECDLCKKVGIQLPASNHVMCKCTKLRDHVAVMSAPTHQPHGNPPSK
eukprot:2206796-Rhodomonas_salina.1